MDTDHILLEDKILREYHLIKYYFKLKYLVSGKLSQWRYPPPMEIWQTSNLGRDGHRHSRGLVPRFHIYNHWRCC